MKRTNKILITLLIIGFIGVAATVGAALGTGHVRPYAETRRYSVENVERAEINLHSAQVTAVPTTEDYRVEVYVHAWLPRPLDFDQIISVEMTDGVLNITETPFPAELLGMFPQPYQMQITLYLPAAACAQIEEVRK